MSKKIEHYNTEDPIPTTGYKIGDIVVYEVYYERGQVWGEDYSIHAVQAIITEAIFIGEEYNSWRYRIEYTVSKNKKDEEKDFAYVNAHEISKL